MQAKIYETKKSILQPSFQKDEGHAVNQIVNRPEHFAELPPDEESIAKMQEAELKLYKLDKLSPPSPDGRGTEDPIYWRPTLNFLKTINVNPKHRNVGLNPYPFNLYFHQAYSSVGDKDDFFSLFSLEDMRYGLSSAKIHLNSSPSDKYYDNSHGCLWIISLSSGSRHRLGSVLIQTAIEHSLQLGFEGKINLISSRTSGQFYFKLGFLPDDSTVLEQLLDSKDVDARKMYLPHASINVWKEKIIKNPILLSKEELHKYCQIKPSGSLNKNLFFDQKGASLDLDKTEAMPPLDYLG